MIHELRTFMIGVRASIREEWEAMFSGHFVPYHKLSVLVAIIAGFIFSIFMSHDIVFEARTAVIDLDQTRWSAEVVEKLNASPYVSIRRVTHSPVDPIELTKKDSTQAVIYIPKGAQKAVLQGKRTVTLGLYLDDSNSAQNGELTSEVTEIVNELGAEIAAGRGDGAASLGRSENELKAILAPLSIGTRSMINPTAQAMTATVINFVLFFSMIYEGLCGLMINGRLRVTHHWDALVMNRGLMPHLARGIPYAFIYATVVTTAVALLSFFGQLRFEGSPTLFAAAAFCTALANIWVGLILSWNCATPGEGGSRLIFLVPPGFILGGMSFATGYMHEWVQDIAFGLPLVWLFKFWRDVGLRGFGWMDDLTLIGDLLCYLAVIALLVGILYWREQKKRRAKIRAEWEDLKNLPAETQS